MSSNPIRIFVGGTKEHWLPTKVLEFSILRRTSSPFEFRSLWDCGIECPEPKDKANRPATSFSLQRFMIPEACQFQGKGIYIDSDMILWADIRELWETEFPDGATVLAPPGWQTSVLLWDATCGLSVKQLVADMDSGKREMRSMMNFKGIAGTSRTLNPLWNCMDRPKPDQMIPPGAKLLHWTEMRSQPWLKAGHPHEEPWIRELQSALRQGHVTREDIMREIELKNVRPSLARVVSMEPPYADSEFIPPNDLRS